MLNELSLLHCFQFSVKEWNVIKILTILFWLFCTIPILLKYQIQLQPEGVCNYINCALFSSSPAIYFSIIFLITLSLFYVLEKRMLISTFLIAVSSVIIFSLEISNVGHSNRTEIVSLLFIAQFIAYLRYSIGGSKFKAETSACNLAMMYSIQIIAAAYIISGISKLGESGIGWVTEAQNISIRIIRSYASRAIDLGDYNLVKRGRNLAAFILKYQLLIKVGFGFVLIAELFAFIAMLGKNYAQGYLLVIALLHGGIFLIFGGVIVPFIALTVIYFLPFSILQKLFSKQQIRKSPPANSKQIPCTGLIENIFNFKIAILYIAFTFIVPEVHPFSRFAMFSSTSNTTDYYYVADENNMALSSLKNFSIHTNEIKNLVYAQAAKLRVNTNDNEQLKNVAKDILKDIHQRKVSNPGTKYFKELKLVRHIIQLNHGKIAEHDVTLASLKME